MKHSNVFYKRNRDRQYEPEKDAKAVRNKAGIDLFRVGFTVHEGKTGFIINLCDNMDQIKHFVARLETDTEYRQRCQDVIEAEVGKSGLSPRYTRPEEKYADIFPPIAGRLLANALNQNSKSWFHKFYDKNGIQLYTMEKEKKVSSPTMYVQCNGWMVDVGPQYRMDQVIDLLSQQDFNMYDDFSKRFEAAIAQPNRWVDMGIAQLLGRYEEADAHNQPIREAREAERQAEQAERTRQEEERRLQEQQDYEAAILKAEQQILYKRELLNDEVRGTSLILQVFRENGVELPLKTQGWVKSSLHSLYYNDKRDFWSYRYRGRESTVIGDYIEKLVDAIQSRHGQTPVSALDDEDDLEL